MSSIFIFLSRNATIIRETANKIKCRIIINNRACPFFRGTPFLYLCLRGHKVRACIDKLFLAAVGDGFGGEEVAVRQANFANLDTGRSVVVHTF